MVLIQLKGSKFVPSTTARSSRRTARLDAQAAQITTLTQQLASRPTTDDVNAAISANSSANSNGVDGLDMDASDPPTQWEVHSVIYKLNVLIGALHRQA